MFKKMHKVNTMLTTQNCFIQINDKIEMCDVTITKKEVYVRRTNFVGLFILNIVF